MILAIMLTLGVKDLNKLRIETCITNLRVKFYSNTAWAHDQNWLL